MSELLIEKLYSLQEVAKMLRVSERTVFRYINGENTEGRKLRASKIGYWKISGGDIRTFLSENANILHTLDNKINRVYIKPSEIAKTKKMKK